MYYMMKPRDRELFLKNCRIHIFKNSQLYSDTYKSGSEQDKITISVEQENSDKTTSMAPIFTATMYLKLPSMLIEDVIPSKSGSLYKDKSKYSLTCIRVLEEIEHYARGLSKENIILFTSDSILLERLFSAGYDLRHVISNSYRVRAEKKVAYA